MSSLNETSEELITIVTDNKDSDDNTILGLLVGAGVPFGKAKGILGKIMTSQGFRLSAEEMDEKAEELLAAFSVDSDTTSDEVAEQIDNLIDELGCTANKSRNYVKALFTGADVAYPKPAKKASGPREPREPGYRGDVKTSADYALAFPEAGKNDKEDFKAYMDEHGGSLTKNGTDKSSKWYSSVVDLRIFGKAWQAKHC